MKESEPNMHELFKQLLESMRRSCNAAVISEYDASGIRRSLVCEDNQEAWNTIGRSGEKLSLTNDGTGIAMIEYYCPNPRMVIMGGGHIALPLSRFGSELGFRVTVFDDRPYFASSERFPDAESVICDSFDNAIERLKINKNDYVIIVTRGHRYDALCLRGLLTGDFPRYAGMIGSKRKVAMVREQMEKETGETEKLSRLHAPIGLAIGAVTPAEIAISILAEMIMDLRLGCRGPDGGPPAKPQDFINPDMDLLEWLAAERNECAALATVVLTNGSTPREKGAKMAILESGQTIGSIGGGLAEAEAVRKARGIIQGGGYCLIDVDLAGSSEDDGMVCGGLMKILIEAVNYDSGAK